MTASTNMYRQLIMRMITYIKISFSCRLWHNMAKQKHVDSWSGEHIRKYGASLRFDPSSLWAFLILHATCG